MLCFLRHFTDSHLGPVGSLHIDDGYTEPTVIKSCWDFKKLTVSYYSYIIFIYIIGNISAQMISLLN